MAQRGMNGYYRLTRPLMDVSRVGVYTLDSTRLRTREFHERHGRRDNSFYRVYRRN